MKRQWVMASLALATAACGSESGSTGGGQGTARTVASLIAEPPAASGQSLELDDVVVIVSQRNGQKWRAFVQDPGTANGIGVFCDGTAATPCTVVQAPMGEEGSFQAIWSPQVASKLEPVSFASRGRGQITYLEAATNRAVAGAPGTPVHLTGGPWRVSNANVDAMKNPSYAEGDCAGGPPVFGVEVVDESDGTTFPLVVKWFDTVSLTTARGACASGKTSLVEGTRFTRLGGLVEQSAFGTSTHAIEPFADADWEVR